MVAETIRVLHVDDDPAFVDTAAAFVEQADDRIEVETAHSADEALGRLRETDVDCVVSDYDMPGHNGIELLRAVRETHPDLPFVLFTGKGSEEVASDAISAGVTDYLQKETGTDQYTILAHRIGNAVSAARVESESEERRHRLEQILKTVPGCVVQLDADGRFTYANRRAKTVLGLEQSAVVDRVYNDPAWRIRDLSGDPIPDEELPFRRVLATGESVAGYRHTIEWPDGTRRVLLVNGAPLLDADGDVESVVFSLVDITDQHERERTLRETERRLELVLAATGTGVWEWDLQTGAVRWDETLERVLGLEPGAFEGTIDAFERRVHPDDRGRVRAQFERAVETGETYEATFRMFHEDADERIRWVAARGSVVEENDGRRMVGVHQDITRLRTLQSELRATTDQYQTVVENLPYGGMFLYDESLECVLAGGRGITDVGLEPDDIVGSRPNERYPEPIAGEIETALRDAFEGESREFEQTYKGRTYQVWTLPIESVAGRIDRVMAVSREITEYRRRERELKEQTDRFAEFAGVVSHDLRNPLGVADGRIELARTECDSEHLDAASRALDRIRRIVEDVLWLAQEGRDIGERETLDLREQVKAAWALTADGDERASLAVHEAAGDLGTIEADENRVAQLLENLFRNSIRHGGDDVTVTVGPLDDGFYVEDDGPGIPEAERSAVFEAGYSTTERGSGFGLRIVRQIAAAHGWAVTVGERTGGGARFEFTGVERGDR